MKIISFAWTTEALKKGLKTQTRRFWKDRHARRFKKGDRVLAYDRLPHAGGKPIAVIELTDDPYQEKFAEISHEDFIAEGGYFYWDGRLDFIDLLKGAGKGDAVWVVKFKLCQVLNG